MSSYWLRPVPTSAPASGARAHLVPKRMMKRPLTLFQRASPSVGGMTGRFHAQLLLALLGAWALPRLPCRRT